MNLRCNVCGNEMDEFDISGGISFNKQLGYGSLKDGKTVDLHVCCQCLDKIIDKCKISPLNGGSKK